MINKNTLFILGAGASKDFGFPIGLELTEMLCMRKGSTDHVQMGLQQCGFTETQIRDFRNELYWSGKDSIDLFLESRTDLAEIGKCAIAAALIPLESPGGVFKFWDNWYRILFAAMRGQHIEHNRVAFITFNYERSLEHFLVQAIHKSNGVKETEAARVVRGIPIVHVYGALGAYPGLAQEKEHERPYTGGMSPDAIRLAAGGIELIGERAADNARLERTFNLVRNAKRIIFLGFSFDQTNMTNIKWPEPDIIDSISISGTAYGLSNIERQLATSSVGRSFRMGAKDEKCHDYLRGHVNLSE